MSKKIALVTGGSRGLGKNMALRLAEKGHDVIITYNTKKEEALEVVTAIENLGQKAATLQLDVNNIGSLTQFIEDVSKILKEKWNTNTFDFLINNAGIGATVFFTAVMAFIASSYALFTVFDNVYTAVFFGIIWGLLIFNLDRFIVSTIKKRDNFLDEFIQATPRIVLAIIIAIVISKPLEIKIFQKEINTVLLKEKNEMAMLNKKQVTNYFKSDVDKNKTETDSLKSAISKKEKEVTSLYQSYITEAEGTAGTKKMGKGPIYKEKRVAYDLAAKQLDSIQLNNSKK